MRTAQEVFDIAIRLMDAQNESTGSTRTADTKEYMVRAPSLLNSILDRAYPASDNYPGAVYGAQRQRGAWGESEQGSGAGEAGFAAARRPVMPKLKALEDEIELDDYICTGVLPYGLAGLLLTEENPAMSDFFWQTFLEQLELARRSLPSREESVEDTYGALWDGIEFGRFSRW